MDYSTIATAAKTKATNIVKGKEAVRILQAMKDASDTVVASIRHYAKVVRDSAKADKELADVEAKRATNQDMFNQAIGQVPGLTDVESALVTAALAKDRDEAAKDRVADAEAKAESLKASLESAAKRIDADRKELVAATADMDKLNAGEIEVDENEVNDLAETLIEEERTA